MEAGSEEEQLIWKFLSLRKDIDKLPDYSELIQLLGCCKRLSLMFFYFIPTFPLQILIVLLKISIPLTQPTPILCRLQKQSTDKMHLFPAIKYILLLYVFLPSFICNENRHTFFHFKAMIDSSTSFSNFSNRYNEIKILFPNNREIFSFQITRTNSSSSTCSDSFEHVFSNQPPIDWNHLGKPSSIHWLILIHGRKQRDLTVWKRWNG